MTDFLHGTASDQILLCKEQLFFNNKLMDGKPHLFVEDSGKIRTADKKLAGDILDADFLINMAVNIGKGAGDRWAGTGVCAGRGWNVAVWLK